MSQANYGYGNVVVIEYRYKNLTPEVKDAFGIGPGKSLYMLYAHLEKAPTVGVGDSVYPGKVIGSGGSTGNSTGPHLHLGTRVDGSGALTGGEMCTDNTCFSDGFRVNEHYSGWVRAGISDDARYGQWARMKKFDPTRLHECYND